MRASLTLPKWWRAGAQVQCCPRCGAAYESALHRLCAAEQRHEEEKAGWR